MSILLFDGAQLMEGEGEGDVRGEGDGGVKMKVMYRVRSSRTAPTRAPDYMTPYCITPHLPVSRRLRSFAGETLIFARTVTPPGCGKLS